MKVTARMIAEQLNLSTATVDRVLNNRKGVSEKTIRRIKEKAAELGYKPNKAAKYLATGKKTEVAFILPVAPQYFWDEIESEIRIAARIYEDYGFEVCIHRLKALPAEYASFIQKQIDSGEYDGVVIAVSPHDAKPYVEMINKGIKDGVPIFTLSNDVPQSNRISFVGGDYYQAGFLAAELVHLFSRKRENMILVTGSAPNMQLISKEQGFREYFRQNDIRATIRTLPVVDIIPQCSKEAAEAIQKADSIYVASSQLGEIAEQLVNCTDWESKVLIGHDMNEKVHTYLQSNVIKGIIWQDPSNQAALAVRNVFSYLVMEENIQPQFPIKLEIVTKANAGYYYKKRK